MAPPSEEQRLERNYAEMSEEQLRTLAASASSLTDLAHIALQKEFERRRLTVELSDSTSKDVLEFHKLVTIRQFRDLPEALLAKGSLDSAGIECYLGDDNMVRMDWFISNLIGGVKLRVSPENAEAANAVLDQPIPEDFDVEGVGAYHQPRCPQCQSLDVTFEELNKPVAYTSAWLRLPLPLQRKAWRCLECKCEWEETEETNRAEGDASTGP